VKLHFGILGALLLAAPVFCQTGAAQAGKLQANASHPGAELPRFQLSESPADIRKSLGDPHVTADFGQDFVSWNYQIDVKDTHEFSHQLVLRRSTGTLISVARNYEEPQNVDELFPEDQTKTYYFPDAEHRQYSVRGRRLGGGRILLAMGVSARGQTTTQLLLILESELPHFHPWLAQQLR
jgi:hypothetical protein